MMPRLREDLVRKDTQAHRIRRDQELALSVCMWAIIFLH
jgi:hypothetical protein